MKMTHTNTTPSPGAFRQIEKVAEGIRREDPTLSREQSITKAAEKRPDLARKHYEEARKSLPAGYFAFQKIEKAAKELRQKQGGLTEEQAILKIAETRPDLVSKYREEVKMYG